MSTCPDADLYSAYVDGEVPSPWKEKLEAHSAVCPDCRKRVQRYQALHSLMKKEIAPVGQTFLDESWERLRVRAAAAAC
ncbi:MAG TPA: zf-HC2 domain-containing protein, partial [Treponemataceae bacterium]|nr:zf-HC2 domain-containing protein [Treponemataceae bacterium]